MPNTTNMNLPYPALSSAPNVPQDIQNLAQAIDTAAGAPYLSYTPAWTATTTNPVLGNGTIVGTYRQVGKTVDFRCVITVGSTTTAGSGVYRISLPVTPKADQLVPAIFHDTSTAQYYTMMARISLAATTGDNMRVAVSGNAAQWGATIPVAPASPDVIIFQGSYEAA